MGRLPGQARGGTAVTARDQKLSALADALDSGARIWSPRGDVTGVVRSAYGRLQRAGIDRASAAAEAVDLVMREGDR